MLIRGTGILQFEPEDKTKKHIHQAAWKRVAIIQTNDDLCEYYAWFVKQRFGLKLNRPLRGSHITIINDAERELPNYQEAVDKFNGQTIDFFLDVETSTNGNHWWLNAQCEAAEEIREACGASRKPYFPFHLTIGFPSPLTLEHSLYISRSIDRVAR